MSDAQTSKPPGAPRAARTRTRPPCAGPGLAPAMSTVLALRPDEQLDTAAARQAAAITAVESWSLTLASPATRKAYRHAVLRLLSAHGEITPTTLAAWRDEQTAAGLSRATIRQRLAAVRAFAAWAAQTGRLPHEQLRDLAAVQGPRLSGEHAPTAIGVAQLRALDRAATALWPEDPLRTAQARAGLRLLGGCGLRVAELAGAEHADLRTTPEGPVLHVHGKRGRRRTVPVPGSVHEAVGELHALLEARARPLVPALSGHRPARVLPRAVAVRTTQALVARLAQEANQAAGAELVPVDVAHPHALRHGYALRYLAQPGATLAVLQRRLGHTDIATTAKYLAAHQDTLEAAPVDPWAP